MLQIIPFRQPQLKVPTFSVDQKLSPELDEYELLSNMNKSFACAIIGRAGSGKTSLLHGLLNTKGVFKKVFHQIFVFMPSNSRSSMSNCIFNKLPDDQIHDHLNLETLNIVFAEVEDNAKNKKNSLIVFDDVQQFFKGECEDQLLHMVNNRRHNRLSMFFIAQSYKKIPRKIRLALSDMFVFKLSKDDMEDIYTELAEIDASLYLQILEMFKELQRDKNTKHFMYLHVPTQRFFIDWDEVKTEHEATST